MAVRTCAVLAVVVCLGVGATACSRQVDHVLYEGAPPEPEAVTTVSEMEWEWTSPEESTLKKVLAGTAGAVMVMNDGVIAVNGATGEELWHYRNSDAEVVSANTTPDGETAMVVFTAAETGVLDVVLLNATTGTVLGEYTAVPGEDAATWSNHVTDDVSS